MSESIDPSRNSLEFDALAELFLGENGQSAPKPAHESDAPDAPSAIANGHHADVVGTIGLQESPREQAPAKATIEALVVGHLPVRTGPWLAQYAAALAKADAEPVGLIRMAETEIRIDLVGAEPMDHPTELESLEEAIEAATARAGRWMIQVGDLDVPWLLHSPLVDAITLLAGGNEAALVDAYRTIKTLVAGAPVDSDANTEQEKGAPAIRLAIMGADEDRAHTVADRLRDASRAFLGREIELAAAVREMGPTHSIPLYRGRTSLDIRAILDELRRGSRRKPTPPAPEPVVRTRRVEPAPPPSEAALPLVEVPRPAASVVEPRSAEPPARPAAQRTAMESAPAPALALPLVAHLDSLTPLTIPYPDDTRIEFAIDDDACAHILQLDTDQDGAGVSSLTAASAWLSRHIALINMAIAPRGPLRADAPPILHLFTRRPKAIRPLLDAQIRLHALAPVRRDRDWVSLDLN